MKATLQLAVEDCTGCGACVHSCPAYKKVDGQKTEAKAINMEVQDTVREVEAANWEHFLTIPYTDPSLFKKTTVKGSQLLQPLFEFSGACAGCGETPYVKLMSQLFGDRAVIANATGCTSIYGGNLPTTPYCQRPDGRGPTWSNSLFEDAAEFGLGMRLTTDKQQEYALELVDKFIASGDIDKDVLTAIKDNPQKEQEEIEKQRDLVAKLKDACDKLGTPEAKNFKSVADLLVKRSVWIIGGDGWAYDIGYGGLDHVLASGKNVNVLCLDTEVYSNTGGQMSKATPVGAIAKFAAGGKPIVKKDLGMMAMSYGYVYVARIAMGANKMQTLKAFAEAEAYDGPSLIIAYSHCIAQGINMTKGMDQQKAAVDCGMWPLYRFNPMVEAGKNPLTFDSVKNDPATAPIDVADYMYSENRFSALKRSKPEDAEKYLGMARDYVKNQYANYKYLSEKS